MITYIYLYIYMCVYIVEQTLRQLDPPVSAELPARSPSTALSGRYPLLPRQPSSSLSNRVALTLHARSISVGRGAGDGVAWVTRFSVLTSLDQQSPSVSAGVVC